MFLNEPRTSSPGSGVKRLSIRRHVGAFGSITVNWNIVSYFIISYFVIVHVSLPKLVSILVSPLVYTYMYSI